MSDETSTWHREPLDLPPVCPRPNCGMETKPPYPYCPRCGFSLLHEWEDRAPSGPCLYCRKTRKLTDEHVFGNWLGRIYKAAGFKSASVRKMRPEFHSMGPTPMHMHHDPVKLDPYDLQIKAVCGECNRGWMHDNVDAAIPLVQNLAEGGWPDFTPQQQLTLARWVTIVSINLACFHRYRQTLPYQLDELIDGKMPKGWATYAWMRSGGKFGARSHTYETWFLPPEGAAANAITSDATDAISTAGFCIEDVIFYSIRAGSGAHLARVSKFPHQPPVHLIRRLWPFAESRLKGLATPATWANFNAAFFVNGQPVTAPSSPARRKSR